MFFVSNLILTTLRMSTPILLASMGGLIGEKSGVLNIGLEGMMLGGSFAAVVGAYISGSPIIGMLFGIMAGILLALIHGVICIKCCGNQTISGIGINMLAVGLTSFGLRAIFGRAGSSDTVAFLPTSEFLREIPFIGDSLASLSPYVYIGFVVVIITWFIFYKTPIGLRLITTGENPIVAETAGVNVWKVRYISMIVCGGLCGLGGAYLSVGQMNLFQESMVSGRGFLAMTAIIMGKWTPLGTMASSLFFGFFDAMQLQLQLAQYIHIPPEFLMMLPYIMCLVALAGFIGKSAAPESRGIEYVKNKKSKTKIQKLQQ